MKKLPLIFLCVLLAAVAIAGVLMPGKANYVDTGSLQSFDTTVTAEEDYSQWQVPVLKVGGHEDPAQVYLKDLGIKVNVTGNIATTTLTMVFQNRTSLILEGELLFPLPEGVTVSGYALDINGKMRKAVPVEKAKATQVFEEIERRRVDPGLLEKVEGNNFRTRIYPIPGNGSRTISITYEQELKVENGRFTYYLPLDYKDKIEEFSLQANVFQPGGKPEFAVRQTSNIRFDQQGMNYVASFKRSAYHPQQALKFSLPVVEDVPEVLVQEIEGNYYFYVNTFVKAQSQKKTWGDTLGIVWDASWSAQNRDLLKELMVLDKIIALKKNLTIHLTTFNYTFDKIGTFTITNGNWGELRKAIEAVVYDGGTNYSSIDLAKIPANEYILFSDGLSTFSEATFACSKPLHCVVSASKADYSTLKWLAIQHEGKFINLQSLSVAAVEREVQNESLQLLGVKHSKSVREVYPGIATPVQGYASVVGITGAGPELITLQFGYGKTVTAEKQIELNPKKHSVQADVQRIWAQKALAEMDLQYDKNKALINTLGHQLGIVTRGTSLMVLETLDDYRHYNITPPEDMLTDSKEDDVKEYSDERSLFEKIRGAIDGLEYWWREKVIGDEIQEVINEDYVMLDDIAPVEEAPQVQETRPIQNEAKFTPPVVAPDEEVVEEMVSQEELQTKIAGSQNIMGDDSGEVIIIETPSTRMVKIGVVEAEDPVPVAAVEVQPSFPGGMEKFDEYIMRNISRDLEGVEGILRVNICFVVEKNGSISNVEILRDGGFPTIARAIAKAFEQMPKWDAGMTNGRAVRVLYIKPVVIRAYGATTSVTSSAITNATTRSERMVTNEVLVLERATTSATIR